MNLRKECRNYVNTVDRSSGASPFWRDCVQIYKKADANNGDFWMFMNKANEGENTLVKHGTCAFGVHVHKGHGPLGSLGLVGYQDILEVLMATERMAAATWAANDNRLEKGKFESLDGKQITRRLRDDARVQTLGLAFTTTTALPTTDLELSSLSPPPPPSTLTTTNNTTTDLNITESAHPILATRGEQWECKDYSETIVESSRGLGSPRWGDCLKMYSNVAYNGAGWRYPNWNGGGHQELAHELTCAFGVRVLAGQHPQGTWAKVGDRDLKEIMQRIREVKNGGKEIGEEVRLKASGKMMCYIASPLIKKLWRVEWDLYKYCPQYTGYICG
ncbi:hypothetical protein SMACR_07283 [Sordaria macrospora]|uniref:Ecp2 effector protein-like domain-containing protein n=1 Tax=Sordaria macrospora TaxID=5147 RepID=A0A8S8ZME1_SORMA|nr:hypothetical protein SMACR_07283 [Sordaria macrospora]KAH7625329.1 hypothetical protein B0T09DRAFT_369288 [Sordaria sp. MPI-SDFR-AT-0083]WPJ62681.1 hypothetical protein SMAC4_07283 [Sordaria macrospora]